MVTVSTREPKRLTQADCLLAQCASRGPVRRAEPPVGRRRAKL